MFNCNCRVRINEQNYFIRFMTVFFGNRPVYAKTAGRSEYTGNISCRLLRKHEIGRSFEIRHITFYHT